MKRELTRISDFIVARRILEIVCHKNRCDFVNLAIDFGRHEQSKEPGSKRTNR